MKNTLTYPSYSGWITARTDDIQLTTDNAMLIMPKPIAELSHIWLNATNSANVRITYNNALGDPVTIPVPLSDIQTKDSDGTYHNIEMLDLKPYVVEYDEYRTLSTQSVFEWQTSNNTKNNTSYYTRYSKEIKLCTAEASWGTLEPILNAVQSTLNDRREKGETFYYSGFAILVIGTVSASTSLLLWRWRVEYEPLGESVKLNVPKTNAEEIPFAIPYNQQQQIASSVGLGRNMQSVANRTGTEQKPVVRYITKLSQMRRVGAVATLNGEIWRLTEVAGTFTPIRARITETWTKGWSMRSEYVGINREFRSWNIPSQITERNLLYQDYCLITRKSNLNLSGAKISEGAHKLLMYYIDSKKTATTNIHEQTAMWLMRNSTSGVVLSATAFGFGNSLVFSARTKDNLSAGIKRMPLVTNDSNYQQNVDVYYCNEDGTLEKMYVEFAPDIGHMDANAYPESKVGETNTPDGYVRLFNQWVEFAVDKDPGEQINFTYQLHILTDDPNLIIGTAWAGKNYLVHQYGSTAPTRKYWRITKRLPQGAQVMTSVFGETTTSSVCTVTEQVVNSRAYENITFTVPSGSLGVCVTDENNNILVAWQGGASATFTTYYTHDYGAIKKAVKG